MVKYPFSLSFLNTLTSGKYVTIFHRDLKLWLTARPSLVFVRPEVCSKCIISWNLSIWCASRGAQRHVIFPNRQPCRRLFKSTRKYTKQKRQKKNGRLADFLWEIENQEIHSLEKMRKKNSYYRWMKRKSHDREYEMYINMTRYG